MYVHQTPQFYRGVGFPVACRFAHEALQVRLWGKREGLRASSPIYSLPGPYRVAVLTHWRGEDGIADLYLLHYDHFKKIYNIHTWARQETSGVV